MNEQTLDKYELIRSAFLDRANQAYAEAVGLYAQKAHQTAIANLKAGTPSRVDLEARFMVERNFDLHFQISEVLNKFPESEEK